MSVDWDDFLYQRVLFHSKDHPDNLFTHKIFKLVSEQSKIQEYLLIFFQHFSYSIYM